MAEQGMGAYYPAILTISAVSMLATGSAGVSPASAHATPPV
jgi:hypothetical protein